ncbi:hypothetical protein KR009_006021, partial [Drosophila setifemur]
DARFPMRCVPLLTVLMLSFLLANHSEAVKQIKPNRRPGGGRIACKANQKASQMASKAACEAKAAKDAQPCAAEAAGHRVKNMLADKAAQAAKAAEAVLAGKKQLLQELSKNLCETQRVIHEVQRAISASSCAVKAETRIRDSVRRNMGCLKAVFGRMSKNLDNIRRTEANAQKEVGEKRSLLDAAKRRVDELHKCVQHAQVDLEKNRENAKKANCSAEEAKQRINVMQQLVAKIKKLKRKDLQSLTKLLRRRRRHSQLS